MRKKNGATRGKKPAGRHAGSEKRQGSAVNFEIGSARVSADIWFEAAFVLGEPKYWAKDMATVGA